MFYTFNQNNSGGHWVESRALTKFVIVEAKDATEANSIAETLGIYFDGASKGYDCPCCGNRWYEQWNGSEKPEVYGESPEVYDPIFVNDGDVFCRVFYLNGSVAEYCKAVREPKMFRVEDVGVGY